MVVFTLPDGSKKTVETPVTGQQLLEQCVPHLKKEALVISVNGTLQDLATPIENDADIQFFTFKDEEGKKVFWHSSAHLMAQAVLRCFPEAKLAIGPTWEGGFFYDIEHAPFSDEDVKKIESEMEKVRDEKLTISRTVLNVAEAKQSFKDNPYKLEVLDTEAKEAPVVTVYTQGEFSDPCRGPHVPSTDVIRAMKILRTSGAYWRGDAQNKQLQRLYGISFPKEKQLKEHLDLLEEAGKREHRKLGKQLGLFLHTELSPGAPIFLPKGATILNNLINFLREEYHKRGYQEVITPLLYEQSLWEQSGHWEHYKEHMFILEPIENKSYSLKPMNCPSHLLIYKSSHHSYRDLPLRLADFAPLHRNELSGTLSGLVRVRKFQQDDAHHFITPEQIEEELNQLFDFINYLYNDVFGFSYTVELSTKPDKALGSPALWEQAENALENSMQKNNISYTINVGDGAFYGPKIDFHLKDSLGRSWQCGTIQLDFNLPERFDANYEGADGKKHRPVIIHRALFGSLERFLGMLIEHYAGKFPLWLSPEQVRILPVSDQFVGYANTVANTFREQGVRVTVDSAAESVSYKVRNAQLAQVNYILVVGEKEVSDELVTIRTRDNKVIGQKNNKEFLQELLNEIKEKR